MVNRRDKLTKQKEKRKVNIKKKSQNISTFYSAN